MHDVNQLLEQDEVVGIVRVCANQDTVETGGISGLLRRGLRLSVHILAFMQGNFIRIVADKNLHSLLSRLFRTPDEGACF